MRQKFISRKLGTSVGEIFLIDEMSDIHNCGPGPGVSPRIDGGREGVTIVPIHASFASISGWSVL